MAAKRPNVLVIVADDLGFSDTSPYGGEIDTPNLQRLADEGVRMTNFHTAASCSPTRAMLLSGTDAHIAGIGCMAERMKKYPEIFQNRPGYEGYLNYRVAAMSEILQDNDYFTLHSGKWHLGFELDKAPRARGFDKVLSFLPGSGNHYNHEPQLQYTEEKPKAVLKGRGLWVRDDKMIQGGPDGDLPKNWYSTTSFTDHFIETLETRTDDEKAKPFFGYLAYTAPHWPLQAPAEKVKKYRGKYDDGPIALRERRLKSLTQNGIIPSDVEPAPMHMLGTTPWADLPEDEKKKSCRAMEIFAGMVDTIDENVGRVLDYLTKSGELENTIIFFLSDNGAEGQLLEAIPVLAGATMDEVIKKYYNNSLDNLGNYDSFFWYGPQWASAATAPSRALKSYTTEGGIRCPCIVRYPASIAKEKGGTIISRFTTVMDILPTCLDLANISHPSPRFRGRDVVPMRGRSWLQLFQNPTTTVVYDDENDIVGWEQLGIAAVRLGDWKALFLPPPRGPGRWELYNVAQDPGEVHDLAEEDPAKLKEMITHYETYFQETGMFDAYTMFQERLKQDQVKKWW